MPTTEKDLGELLWQMSLWMQRAEQAMSREQRVLFHSFVAEGRLLREWSDRQRSQLGHEGLTTRTR